MPPPTPTPGPLPPCPPHLMARCTTATERRVREAANRAPKAALPSMGTPSQNEYAWVQGSRQRTCRQAGAGRGGGREEEGGAGGGSASASAQVRAGGRCGRARACIRAPCPAGQQTVSGSPGRYSSASTQPSRSQPRGSHSRWLRTRWAAAPAPPAPPPAAAAPALPAAGRPLPCRI